MMKSHVWAIALSICLCFSCPASALARSLGPARSYEELLALAKGAQEGDVLFVSGEIAASQDAPLAPAAGVYIRSAGERAAIDALRVRDASISFENIDLRQTLTVEGNSAVHLSGDVAVTGAEGSEGIRFIGSGALLLDSGCVVEGGTSGGAGVVVAHVGGDFYGDLAGTVRGGGGNVGGVGVEIEPLGESGALMVSGVIEGGDGESAGGPAMNLYGLSGNAYVTLDGTMRGGSGAIGGNGAQIVAAADNAVVGVSGSITGGAGEHFGGNALMLMNVDGAATVRLGGALVGGDAIGIEGTPGTSLLVVGDTTSARTSVNGCLLEEGRRLSAPRAPEQPEVTPLPQITQPAGETPAAPETTPESETTPQAESTAAPEESAPPEETPVASAAPEPSAGPSAEPDAQPATPAEPDAPQGEAEASQAEPPQGDTQSEGTR